MTANASPRIVQQLGYRVKRSIPAPGLLALRRIKRVLNSRRKQDSPEAALVDQFPWSSPNVWRRVEDSYRNRDRPTVAEYGIGVSTIWHVRNLIRQGGCYVGVEDHFEWFWKTVQGLTQLFLSEGVAFDGRIERGSSEAAALDAVFELHRDGSTCEVRLRLRPVQDAHASYVGAISEACDVAIVDGRARKACVNHLLDDRVVKPGGTLALFEAGRGTPRWLGSSTLTGEDDYRPVVERLQALGGQLVDGDGLDAWPEVGRRSPLAVRHFYPLEACFLVMPEEEVTT